jgi:hypothetical protein
MGINACYHDNFDTSEPPIRIQDGTARGVPPYVWIEIGSSLDIYMTRERMTELRDTITAYLEPPAVEPAPVDPRPQYLGVAKVEMPRG